MRKHLFVAATVALAFAAGRAAGQDAPHEDDGLPSDIDQQMASPPVEKSAASDALVQKIAACSVKEGNVIGTQEMELLAQAAPGFVSAFTQAKGPCAGLSADACAGRVRGWSCEETAKQLEPEDLLGLGDSNEPAPNWATAFAGAITGKVKECYAVEIKGEPSAEAQQQLDSMQGLLARSLGGITRISTCTADESKLPTCTNALKALPCASLAQQLESSDSMLANALVTSCSGLLQCGVGEEIDDPAPQ